MSSMGTSVENTSGNQTACGKSDRFIVPKKPVKAGGGKGHGANRFKRLQTTQTGAEKRW